MPPSLGRLLEAPTLANFPKAVSLFQVLGCALASSPESQGEKIEQGAPQQAGFWGSNHDSGFEAKAKGREPALLR